MVSVEEARELARTKLSANLYKHCLAVEAVMRALARRFNQDEERWGLAGLLHDIDYEETKNDPCRHSLRSGEIVRTLGFDEEMVQAVEAHNERHGLPRETLMAKALYCSDPLTGLIVAAALIHPSKKLDPITPEFVLNRYHEKSFARGANRAVIAACDQLGLELLDFIAIGLEAMKCVSDALGL
ncbi:MAG: HDIG domain-containing metalloprotein [Bacillota bacterium]